MTLVIIFLKHLGGVEKKAGWLLVFLLKSNVHSLTQIPTRSRENNTLFPTSPHLSLPRSRVSRR
jgi:hypothetical protein